MTKSLFNLSRETNHKDKSERNSLSKLIPNSQLGVIICMYFVGITNCGTMGFDTMMMSGLNTLPQYRQYFHLSAATLGLNTASIWIGSVLSCFLMQPLSDRLGRKLAILISAIICIIGIIIQSAAVHISMFVIGRIIVGFGTELASSPAPTLVSEIVPARYRGSILGFYFCAFNIGALIASGIAYGTRNVTTTWAWRIPSIIQAFFSIMCIIMLPFCPESPRWLISKGRNDEAKEIIEIAENIDAQAADNVVLNIEKNIALEIAAYKSSNPWKILLWRPSRANIRRMIIVLSLACISELGGSQVSSFYLTIILKQAGVSDTKKQLEVGIVRTAWVLFNSYLGSLFIDRLGRKVQAFISVSGMIVSFFILGGLIKKFGSQEASTSGHYGAIAMMFIFSGFYGFTFAPMNCLYPPELYPYTTRSAGTTLFKFFNAGSGLLTSFVLPIGMTNIGWKFYMVNAGYDIIFLPMIVYIWVETKGRTLESIAQSFGDAPTEFDEKAEQLQIAQSNVSFSSVNEDIESSSHSESSLEKINVVGKV